MLAPTPAIALVKQASHGRAPYSAGLLPFLLCLLAIIFCASLEAHAQESVGIVTRVQNQAEIVSSSGTTSARVGTVVHLQDELRTGSGARLQITFRDNTTLTLSENANVVIDRYVFDPERRTGEVALNATRGAVRFATGRLQGMTDKTITVSTPVAQLGVRGSELWAGPLQRLFGALLLKGVVVVSNQGGTVTLTIPGWGTDIISFTQQPGNPSKWSPAKMRQALDSTEFETGSEQEEQEEQQQERRDQRQRRGEESTPDTNQQYTVNSSPGSLLAVLGLQGLFAVIVTTRANRNEIRPISP